MDAWQKFRKVPGIPNLYLGAKAHLHVGRKAKIQIKGSLYIGWRYEHTLAADSLLKIDDRAQVVVTGKVRLGTGGTLDVTTGATLRMGGGGIGYHSTLIAFERITLGTDFLFGEQTVLRDSDTHALVPSKGPVTAPIEVGNHVWIGMRSTLLKGVSIGDGAVVAACSLVVRDVPARCLVGGVPAKVLKEAVTWA